LEADRENSIVERRESFSLFCTQRERERERERERRERERERERRENREKTGRQTDRQTDRPTDLDRLPRPTVSLGSLAFIVHYASPEGAVKQRHNPTFNCPPVTALQPRQLIATTTHTPTQ